MTATYPDALTAGAAARSVLGSQVVPTAVELDGPADAVRVTVLVEGVEAGVTARADTVAGLLGAGAEPAEDPPDGLGALPFTADGTGIKVTSSLTGVGPVLAAAHAMAAEQGVDVAVTASAAGVLHTGTGPDADPVAVAAMVDGLRAAAAPFGGTAPSSRPRRRYAPSSTCGDRCRVWT